MKNTLVRLLTGMVMIIVTMIITVKTQAVWVLDNMDVPQQTSYNNDSTVFIGNPAFGNYRTIKWGASNQEGYAEVQVYTYEGTSYFSYNQGVKSITSTKLLYNANGAGLNLNLSDINSFGILGVYADLGGFNINYSIIDNNNILASGNWMTHYNDGMGPYDLVDYIGPQPGWTSIDAILIEFNPLNKGSDLMFDAIGWESRSGFIPNGDPSIPEPSSTLLISGILGIGMAFRKLFM